MPASGDFQALRGLILAVEKFPKSARMKATKQLGEATRGLLRRQFREGRNPDGRTWRKPRHGGKPLSRTGAFERSFTVRATATGLSITTSTFWWRVHNEGRHIYAKRGEYLHFSFVSGRGGSRRQRWARVRKVYIYKRQIIPSGSKLGSMWSTAFAQVLAPIPGAVFAELL